MKLLLTFSLLLSILSTKAQDTAQKVDNDKTFTKVEIEAVYPGGPAAWLRFLDKALRLPYDTASNNIPGIVTVQFIVDKEGNTSDIQAISGPDRGGFREEAVRIIRISGLWKPAIQNGRQVRSYKKQMFPFEIDNR